MRTTVAPRVNLTRALPAIPTQRTARQPVTIARLMAEPLEGLLADTNVQFIESSITDREFYGAAVVRPSGQTVLLMPANRTELEHDTIARYLLGQALGLDVTDLPKPFDVVVRPLVEAQA
jgi:hypothetical protein